MSEIQGKQHDIDEDYMALEPGEYGKNVDGLWFCRVPAPDFGVGGLAKHEIVEHADGTISVSPSILCDMGQGKQWHGYLVAGIWREV